jgi:hypothetical protein
VYLVTQNSYPDRVRLARSAKPVAETTNPPVNSTEAAGCIVILEPGASWPESAFASVPYRDGVAVVNESPEEPAEHFFGRLARQFAHVSANGVLVRSVLVACTMTSSVHRIDRAILAEHAYKYILGGSNGSVMFVSGDELPLPLSVHR